jgi:ubiquinone/menaquinone biosynthesis C-methylase UbiE
VPAVSDSKKETEQHRMAKSSESPKDERPSTYFVQDRRSKEEFTRVTIQDQMLTTSMGGVLPEQTNPAVFHRILDVGCATGGWAIEAAKTYPTMSLVGIDISEKMIDYARVRASAELVADRVSFHIMDALSTLEFPSASFDLVNMRLGVSFVRTWDWPKLLSEFQRVTRPGCIVRLTEAEVAENDCSPALTHLHHVLRQAFHNAGNFFTPQNDGLTSQLVSLLTRYGLENVQMCMYSLVYRAGTSEGQRFAEDMQHLYRTLRPFLQKWTRIPDDYDAIYRQALVEMQRPDFVATWRFLTAWGSVKAD